MLYKINLILTCMLFQPTQATTYMGEFQMLPNTKNCSSFPWAGISITYPFISNMCPLLEHPTYLALPVELRATCIKRLPTPAKQVGVPAKAYVQTAATILLIFNFVK
jgi:hypothetical protein